MDRLRQLHGSETNGMVMATLNKYFLDYTSYKSSNPRDREFIANVITFIRNVFEMNYFSDNEIILGLVEDITEPDLLFSHICHLFTDKNGSFVERSVDGRLIRRYEVVAYEHVFCFYKTRHTGDEGEDGDVCFWCFNSFPINSAHDVLHKNEDNHSIDTHDRQHRHSMETLLSAVKNVHDRLSRLETSARRERGLNRGFRVS